MVSPITRAPRRTDALSRDRIVAASIEILDSVGEGELTVRAVTTRLATGRGAIYHHVSGKDELLAAAADHVIARVIAALPADEAPAPALRALALGVFDAIDAHPWIAAQLAREPRQCAVLRIWTSVGGQLRRLGLEARSRADAGSAFVSYVLGASALYVAGPRRHPDAGERAAYLDQLAAAWTESDPDPAVAEAAGQLREHDDRQQFLAGVDIFLAGATGPAR